VCVGKKFAASVQSVDLESKHITLSKKNVSVEEAKLCENNFKTMKFIYDIVLLFLKEMEKKHNIIVNVDSIYNTFIWNISTDPEFLVFALKSASKDFNKVY